MQRLPIASLILFAALMTGTPLVNAQSTDHEYLVRAGREVCIVTLQNAGREGAEALIRYQMTADQMCSCMGRFYATYFIGRGAEVSSWFAELARDPRGGAWSKLTAPMREISRLCVAEIFRSRGS